MIAPYSQGIAISTCASLLTTLMRYCVCPFFSLVPANPVSNARPALSASDADQELLVRTQTRLVNDQLCFADDFVQVSLILETLRIDSVNVPSVPEGRAANQPLSATTFRPPIGALLPGALVSLA